MKRKYVYFISFQQWKLNIWWLLICKRKVKQTTFNIFFSLSKTLNFGYNFVPSLGPSDVISCVDIDVYGVMASEGENSQEYSSSSNEDEAELSSFFIENEDEQGTEHILP